MIHLVIDSYGCSTERTDNLRDVYEVINNVVNMIGADAIMPPQLVPYYYCEKPEDTGISAFVLLKGGHFTIHTFPQYGCYFADLLYNGLVSVNDIESLLRREFPCASFSIQRIDRDEFDKSDTEMYQTWDFGPHYMIKSKLDHEPTIDEYVRTLDTMPGEVGMHPITRPCVLTDSVHNPKYLSGIILIAESHIAMHYSYETHEVIMDIFSCNDVENEKFEALMTKLFKNNYEYVLIKRGRKNDRRKDSQIIKHTTHRKWQDVIASKS